MLSDAQHRRWTLLTDDKAARAEAAKLSVRVSGTLGSLVLAVEQKLCSVEQANLWLAEMIKFGYWSPITDLTRLLK